MTPNRDARVFQIALNGPVMPELLRDDAEVIVGDGWRRTVTPSSPWAAENEVLFSNLGDAASDAEIDAEIDRYHRIGRPMRWCVYPWDRPVDLGQRLLARGASQAEVWALIAENDLPLRMVDGVEVEPVTSSTSEAFSTYMDQMITRWGYPADEAEFRRARYARLIDAEQPTLMLFLGRYRGEPAGGGACFLRHDHAYFTGDFVRVGYEARGLLQSLHAARHQAMSAMGLRWATGHGRLSGTAQWVRRFGWKVVFEYQIYQLEPPAVGR